MSHIPQLFLGVGEEVPERDLHGLVLDVLSDEALAPGHLHALLQVGDVGQHVLHGHCGGEGRGAVSAAWQTGHTGLHRCRPAAESEESLTVDCAQEVLVNGASYRALT